MWEQLFLFGILLFGVKTTETDIEFGDVCERGDGNESGGTLLGYLSTNVSLRADFGDGFDQTGFRYSCSDARQEHSVIPSSHLGAFFNSRLRKVMSRLSQVNPTAVFTQMLTSLENLISKVIMANPFLAALHVLAKQMVNTFGRLRELLVLKTEIALSETLLSVNLLRESIMADFMDKVTWVNQWWKAVSSVFKSSLVPANQHRQGRTSASHFLELSAFIKIFHWLRGEEREKVRNALRQNFALFPGCTWKSLLCLRIWLEGEPDYASTSYYGRPAGQR